MPGWQNSDRRDRLPPDWHSIVARIMRRDQRMCQWKFDDDTLCLDPARDVDHIVPGDDHRDANLRALCARHHKRKTGQEGAAAMHARRRKIANSFKRTEEHPGLLS